MYNITQSDDLNIKIHNKFNVDVEFLYIGSEYIFNITNIKNLKGLDYIIDNTKNENNTKYLIREWRISIDGINWSDWINLFTTTYNQSIPSNIFFEEIGSVKISENEIKLNKLSFGDFINNDSKINYSLQIKWTRTGTNSDGILSLTEFDINGWWDRETSYSPMINLSGSDYYYYRVPEVWKAFKFNDIDIVVDGLTINKGLDIDYRFTQNSGRSWSNWEKLNNENISTLKFTPIRFFNIEYRMKRTGDLSGNVLLYELNLIGDFQNVTQDYYKTNKMGIRDCCCLDNNTQISFGNAPNSNTGQYTNGTPQSGTEGLLASKNGCNMPDIFTNPLGNQNVDALMKPYDLGQATQLYNALSTITTQIFGFDVVYFLTSPERNGTDYTFHEYQLYNVKCTGDIKVSVDENQFPDNQIVFNQFDLSLFESFEIHINKETFWKIFGIDERPSKEDFLWFCTINRLYQVEHAQSYRDFNNTSVFWKVILKKFNQKGNIIPSNSTIEDRIQQIVNNTTLDELMGVEKQNDKEDIAFKDQHLTLSQDNIRYKYYVDINREVIDNSTIIVSKNNYNLSSILYNQIAVSYKKMDTYLKRSDNRSFTFWFKLDNIIDGQVNNLINNYNDNTNKGYKISIYNKSDITLTINNSTYTISNTLSNNIWYCYHLNLNQREGYIEHFLYKRDSLIENQSIRLKTSKLLLLKTLKSTLIDTYEFENDNNELSILSSNMKITNIRIWNDIITIDNHTKILNQNIVRDYSNIILSDSCNKKINGLENLPYN